MVAPQVVKKGLRIQIVMSSRSLPFFQHVKPTWTFMLSRALWYPAVLSSSGDLREDGFYSLRRHHRSQLGDSVWLSALVCLTQLFYQSPSFAAVLMWGEITFTPLIAPAQKGIFLCCCSGCSSGCTLPTFRSTSLPNSHCSIPRRKTFRCQTWFCFSLSFSIIPFADSHLLMNLVLVSHIYFVLKTVENNCHK